MTKRKKPKDKEMLDWLADCTVEEGRAIFDSQFYRCQRGAKKTTALRQSIIVAMRADKTGGK